MIVNIVYPAVDKYLEAASKVDDPVVKEMETLAAKEGFPIIGPQVGRLCAMLARSIGAKSVFEMGSGFGYSTWWFAGAVGKGGKVVHTDGSSARSEQARKYLIQADLVDRVTFEVGNAIEIIGRHAGPFDIVFIDIDKEGYPAALEAAKSHVRVGGWIITDNVLWSGKVASGDSSPETEAIRTYTRAALGAEDLLTTVVPVRDGVALSLKVDKRGF